MKPPYPLGLPLPAPADDPNHEKAIARIKARTAALDAAPARDRHKLAQAFRTRLGWGVDGFRDPFRLRKVPALLTARRPGPFEDMGMRDKFLKFMGGWTKLGRKHYYCFDSIPQFKQWFHDEEELKFLADNSFTLSNYVVKESSVIRGEKQTVFSEEGLLYLKARYNLQTLEPL